MTFAISLTRIHQNPTCRLSNAIVAPPEDITARTQAIWDEETQRRSTTLFNGEIVSVVSINETLIIGRRAEYRWLLAQSHDEDFFRWFQVRPLAVTGVLTCPEGIVIGRRSKSVFQFPGLWELAPSGSVDLGTLDAEGNIDLLTQLMQELHEEVGLQAADVANVQPLAIACDVDSQVFDVCFVLNTAVHWEQIATRFSANTNTEYERLEILPVDQISTFLRSNKASTTPLTLSLLQLLENEHKLCTLAPLPVPEPKQSGKERLRTAIIVQARMGSTRLPGKILQSLAGKPILEHVIQRLKRVKRADDIVIATTRQPGDDAVEREARELGVKVYRGDENDVLIRYLGAARMVNADVIMRVTSDCPLIDPDLCDAVLELRESTNADYAANNIPRLFPHGLDCEAFTRDVLEHAATDATEPYDREHVTPWIRRASGIRHANLIGPGWPSNQQRWTLDYPEDFAFFRELFDHLPRNYAPGWQEVLSVIGAQAHLGLTNSRHRATSAPAADHAAGTAVFHFEANGKIGTGHAMRCNALHSRLESLGWRCLWAIDVATEAFLGSNVPPNALIRLTAGTAAGQAAEIGAAIGKCGVFIVDHYGITASFTSAMRQVAERIVCLDDLGNRMLDADVVINPNPGFSKGHYNSLNKCRAQILLGPEYALLRQQFSVHRAELQHRLVTPAAEPLRRVVVAFGGVDSLNGSAVALDVLAQFPDLEIVVALGAAAPHLESIRQKVVGLGERARLITDVADMAMLLARADFVIGAPGTSTWERACLGLPSLLIGIAENQRANAAYVTASGAGLVAGFLTNEDATSVAARLTEYLQDLFDDRELRQRMAIAAAALCDGRGCQRIVAAILQPQKLDAGEITLRVVEARDEELLLDWQREPETRRFALNPAIPSSEEHHMWLQERLLSSIDWFLIAEIDNEPRAFVRLDWIGEDAGRPEYVISIATSRLHHRQGIGMSLLRAIRQLSPSAHFFAKILPDNTASLALFIRAGYRLAADGFFHARPQ